MAFNIFIHIFLYGCCTGFQFSISNWCVFMQFTYRKDMCAFEYLLWARVLPSPSPMRWVKEVKKKLCIDNSEENCTKEDEEKKKTYSRKKNSYVFLYRFPSIILPMQRKLLFKTNWYWVTRYAPATSFQNHQHWWKYIYTYTDNSAMISLSESRFSLSSAASFSICFCDEIYFFFLAASIKVKRNFFFGE